MADIPEMVWSHHQFNNDQIDIGEDAIIWMMKYDVLWSGHLGTIILVQFPTKYRHTHIFIFDMGK